MKPRSVFERAATFAAAKKVMNPTIVTPETLAQDEALATNAPRAGIIDRLKLTATGEQMLSLVREFSNYTTASDKTKRRFLRILMQRCRAVTDQERDEIRQAAQFLKKAVSNE